MDEKKFYSLLHTYHYVKPELKSDLTFVAHKRQYNYRMLLLVINKYIFINILKLTIIKYVFKLNTFLVKKKKNCLSPFYVFFPPWTFYPSMAPFYLRSIPHLARA